MSATDGEISSATEPIDLRHELAEARRHQQATAEILHVISNSPTQVQAVLDSIAGKARELCNAKTGAIFTLDDELIHVAATSSFSPEAIKALEQTYPVSPGRGGTTARAIESLAVVYIPDVRSDSEYRHRFLARETDYLSVAAAPMIRNGRPIGAITVTAAQANAFSPHQIDLLRVFADQAVIAIGNARLFEENEERTRELQETLEYQTALSEVLSLISRAPNEPQPVFDNIIRIASRLCETDVAFIFRTDGDVFRIAAIEPAKSEYIEYLETRPIRLDRSTHVGRAALEGKTVFVADREADPEYSFPGWQKLTRIRSQLAVPLLRDGRPIGVIALSRNMVKPFTPQQVALAESFASQAVIAIENARLFEEEQTRTRELQESLEYQTATSEVLSVISRSPTEVDPVLKTIAATATRLCRADHSTIFRIRDGVCHLEASEAAPEFVRYLEENPIPLDGHTLTARAVQSCQVMHIPDTTVGGGFVSAIVQRSGAKTLLSVPLLRDATSIGVITIGRRERLPFSPREIELVTTFANQAVIAIENARLFEEEQTRSHELQESLEYQTATSEILNIISRSPTDVQPVFDIIARNTVKLCAAAYAMVFRFDGNLMHLAAHHNVSPDGLEALESQWPMRPDARSLPARAVVERRTVHLHDVLEEADNPYLSTSRALGIRTMLTVPIMRGGEPIGAVAAYRQEVDPFSERQIALVATFASQAVIAIENVRLFETEQQRTRELRESLEYQTATSELLNIISRSPTDVQPVFDTIVASAARLCGAIRSNVQLYDGSQLNVVATHNFGPDGIKQFQSMYPMRPHRSQLAGRAVLTKSIVHVHDALADPEYAQDMAKAAGLRALLSVPMLRDGKPYGVITVSRGEPVAFTDRQVDLLKTFADQAVIAIENARLFEQLESRTKELQETIEFQTATSEVLGVISRSPNELQPVLDAIVETATRLCDADYSLFFQNPGNGFVVTASSNADPSMIGYYNEHPLIPTRGSIVGRTALLQSTVHIADFLADPEFQAFDRYRVSPVRTGLGTPLVRNGQTIGVIFLGRKEVRPFSEQQVELITTFADQAVIAINNVRLFEEVQSRTKALAQSVEEMRALGEVGRTVSSSLDLSKVLQTVLENACRMTSAGSGTIYVYDPATSEFRLEAGHNMSAEHTARVRAHPMRVGDPVVGECAESRGAVQIEDVAEEDPERSPLFDVLLRSGVRAILAVPLLHRDKIIGALVVRRMHPGAFSPEAVRLLEAIGAQSAIAINNARLFAEVEETGRALAIASQHKSQFLANMSHELRTPLNAILGYTELIQDGLYGEPNTKTTEVLSRVQSNGKHLLGLINDVLDLSKIEAGELTLSHDGYSMSDAVQTVVAATEALAVEKALRLSADVPTNLPAGVGDERRLVQVLLNLVGNAIKFTDAGEVKISVRSNDARFVIDVTDTGPGIPKHEIARIFEEFHQVDSSATKRKGGTGLGLAISKRIVELHGGQLTVESELGKGSTFRVDLPIRFETTRVLGDDQAHTRH
jgi:GAF domain-containing protein/anti-sigma regulatory factor (Ser/Thr protein kinase)